MQSEQLVFSLEMNRRRAPAKWNLWNYENMYKTSTK